MSITTRFNPASTASLAPLPEVTAKPSETVPPKKATPNSDSKSTAPQNGSRALAHSLRSKMKAPKGAPIGAKDYALFGVKTMQEMISTVATAAIFNSGEKGERARQITGTSDLPGKTVIGFGGHTLEAELRLFHGAKAPGYGMGAA
ncbi:MAG: hypothetical protein JWM42_3170 [Burkholderia sp.]|nr:hypothetical protein [Burkholderia sp.]